jgi:hypothetical protein
MNRYQYHKEKKEYSYGKVHVGYEVVERQGGLLNRDKKETVKKFIYEDEWLNQMGESGWELVSVFTQPSVGYPREYYFKRLK